MKRKHIFKVGMMLLCLLLALCGCETQQPQHLAVVMMHHSNAPVPDQELASDAVAEVCTSGGSVQIIEGDGEPYLLGSVEVDAVASGLSENNRRDIIQDRTQQILQAVGQSVPLTEQADPLSALDLAGRALASKAEGEKRLIVIGSGLMSCWPMDMSQEGVVLSELDPQAVVSVLEESEAIPQYISGMQITWYSIAQTCEPQQELGPKDENKLKEIWTAIAEAAGAQVTFPADLSEGRLPDAELPVVNTVAVQERSSGLPQKPVVIDGAVAFAGNSAELTNLELVDAQLEPLVEVLGREPDSRIALFGSTACAGSAESCRSFGCKRAEAVRQRMIELGASPDQVIAVGIGWEGHSLYTPDIQEDGTLDQEKAAANRVVYMMDAACELSQELISDFG